VHCSSTAARRRVCPGGGGHPSLAVIRPVFAGNLCGQQQKGMARMNWSEQENARQIFASCEGDVHERRERNRWVTCQTRGRTAGKESVSDHGQIISCSARQEERRHDLACLAAMGSSSPSLVS
jgi:hypothetical protein